MAWVVALLKALWDIVMGSRQATQRENAERQGISDKAEAKGRVEGQATEAGKRFEEHAQEARQGAQRPAPKTEAELQAELDKINAEHRKKAMP